MKNISRIIWGVVLVVVGVLFALNALDIADVDVFLTDGGRCLSLFRAQSGCSLSARRPVI